MPDYRLTRAEMRAVDRLSIEEYGIPGIVLMENAGRSVFEWIVSNCVDTRPEREPWRCIVLCGPGNNGGDGFVVARWLFEHELCVECLCTGREAAAHGDAQTMRWIAQRIGIRMHDISEESAQDRWRAPLSSGPVPTLVVDALLGTGFEGRPRAPVAGAIQLANDWGSQGARVVSIDVPSGLDCDTGRALGDAVRSHTTVTFECEKSGFAEPEARGYLGQIVIASVGAPRDAIDRARGSDRRRLTSG